MSIWHAEGTKNPEDTWPLLAVILHCPREARQDVAEICVIATIVMEAAADC